MWGQWEGDGILCVMFLSFMNECVCRVTALIVFCILSKGQWRSKHSPLNSKVIKNDCHSLYSGLRQAFLAAWRLHSPEKWNLHWDARGIHPEDQNRPGSVSWSLSVPRPLLLPHPNPWLCGNPGNEGSSSQQGGVAESAAGKCSDFPGTGLR